MARKEDNDRHISQRQQKALIVLSLLLSLAIVLPSLWIRNKGINETQQDSLAAEAFQKEIAGYSDSLSRLQQQHDSLRRARYKKNRKIHYMASQRKVQSFEEYSSNPHRERLEAYPRPHVAKQLSFDLNSADTLDLQQLHGIGPVFARRIVNYRSKLGGFVSVAQLREVYGLSEETFQKVAPFLTVDTSQIVKLNPNKATLQELKAHPYLDYYQARAIVEYRQGGHSYNTADDLLMVNLITDSVLLPLRPYLTFNTK